MQCIAIFLQINVFDFFVSKGATCRPNSKSFHNIQNCKNFKRDNKIDSIPVKYNLMIQTIELVICLGELPCLYLQIINFCHYILSFSYVVSRYIANKQSIRDKIVFISYLVVLRVTEYNCRYETRTDSTCYDIVNRFL